MGQKKTYRVSLASPHALARRPGQSEEYEQISPIAGPRPEPKSGQERAPIPTGCGTKYLYALGS
jgi:hypothetical protein